MMDISSVMKAKQQTEMMMDKAASILGLNCRGWNRAERLRVANITWMVSFIFCLYVRNEIKVWILKLSALSAQLFPKVTKIVNRILNNHSYLHFMTLSITQMSYFDTN